VNPADVLARARWLLDGHRGRSFLDAAAVEDPPEWQFAPRARVTGPAIPLIVEEPEPEIHVHEEELFTAIVQHVVLILCGHCGRRHFEPLSGFGSRSPYFRCPKCGRQNEVTRGES
jgi:hypothetical protein